jgi:hypothetical protein
MGDGIAMFKTSLYELKDWPDRNMITDLTNLARDYIQFAPTLVSIAIARLVDASTNTLYKKPIFYLLDSIMKTVGGPYPALLEKNFSEIYGKCLKDITGEDNKKLQFLFTTWEERKFFNGGLLQKMKFQLTTPPVVSLFSYYSLNSPFTDCMMYFVCCW